MQKQKSRSNVIFVTDSPKHVIIQSKMKESGIKFTLLLSAAAAACALASNCAPKLLKKILRIITLIFMG